MSLLPIAPAQRLNSLRPSPIRILSEGAPPHAIPLGLGEPTWDLHPSITALRDVLDSPCAYGPNVGLPDLQAMVADQHGVAPESVLVTHGSQEALAAVFLALVNPGDRVLVPDPGYPGYAALAALAGAQAVGYGPDLPGALAALSHEPSGRLMVLNGPANPTGRAWRLEELQVLVAEAERRGVTLVSDEVYRELHLGPRPPSLRDVTGACYVTSSLSKAWGAPGLRVGWLVAPAAWIAPVRTVHGYLVTAAARPSQRWGLELLRQREGVLEASRQALAARWEALVHACVQVWGRNPPRPDGAFYLWVPLPAGVTDGLAFCLRVRDQAGVVLVPGNAFGAAGHGHLRLSYGARPEDLREGIRRLGVFWGPQDLEGWEVA